MSRSRGSCLSRGNLLDTLDIQNHLTFYKIMNYPIPKQYDSFLEGKKKTAQKAEIPFSRDQKNPHMESYLHYITQQTNIYKNLPFVQEIYLCNSISFNALHNHSDIDLFMITAPNRIRTARFRSLIIFTGAGLKRSLRKRGGKFCLSFFISANHQNLYPISLKNSDIYLAYRIQHLVLLYKDDPERATEIFKQNKRVQGILPNYTQQQEIQLWIQTITGRGKFKTYSETIWRSILGDLFEYLVKYLQLLLIRLKILRDPERNKNVILNDHMLKFHQDIREKVSLKYSIAIKK